MENSKIIGDKVILRTITEKDTELIVNWRNNDQVRKNFIFQETFTPEIHNKWLKDKVFTGQVIQYIIEEKETGKPIGSVYFRDIDKVNNSAEFGIFIGEDSARGKGYGTETTQLFIDYGFNTIKLHRVMLRVFQNNISAYNSYLKAGFQIEGVFKDMVRVNNVYYNIMFMSIINNK